MPTLFDSHEEFNEWFSKDIESHAENKSAIDESEYCVVPILLLATVLSFAVLMFRSHFSLCVTCESLRC